MTPSEVERLVEGLKANNELPSSVTGKSLEEISKSLSRYFNTISANKIEEFTSKVVSLLNNTLNTEQTLESVTIGDSPATARGSLFEFLSEHTMENIGDAMNLDFFLRVPTEVAEGAAVHLTRNWDQDRVDAYPAMELRRLYPRDVPRGSEKDPAGPENAWDDEDGRWPAACDEAGDDDAAKVFEDTGRMVALKSSGVWQALGDGAGGYDDTLGNAFEPFAFNSGMGLDEVSYEDCVELGLLEEGEEVEKPDVDLEDLIPGMDARYNPTLNAQNSALARVQARSKAQKAPNTPELQPTG